MKRITHHPQKRPPSLWYSLLLLLMIGGCQVRNEAAIYVLMKNKTRLETNDPVYYHSTQIGTVSTITFDFHQETQTPYYKVKINVLPEYMSFLYQGMLYVTDDLDFLGRERRIIIIDQAVASRIQVTKGHETEGITYYNYLLQQLYGTFIEYLKKIPSAFTPGKDLIGSSNPFDQLNLSSEMNPDQMCTLISQIKELPVYPMIPFNRYKEQLEEIYSGCTVSM